MDTLKQFTELHYQNQPLLLGNVWNTQSALLFQKLGYRAIGTSSAAIAISLGYEDGEQTSFEMLLEIVRDIKSNIDIPLTVDIEGGYSRNIDEIINNIKILNSIGVVGINIEDSVVNVDRNILDVYEFSETILKIKSKVHHMFINVRTDAYIMNLKNPLEETLRRIALYEKAGADGIFIPCILNKNEIKTVVNSTVLPINVMCIPNLPNFDTLESLGVKRISMGPFPYQNMMSHLEKIVSEPIKNQSFETMFS